VVDLQHRIDQMQSKTDELNSEIHDRLQENEDIHYKYSLLNKENAATEEKVRNLNQTYENLKSQ